MDTKDLWPLYSCVLCKVVNHTVAAWVNVTQGRRPLEVPAILDQRNLHTALGRVFCDPCYPYAPLSPVPKAPTLR